MQTIRREKKTGAGPICRRAVVIRALRQIGAKSYRA